MRSLNLLGTEFPRDSKWQHCSTPGVEQVAARHSFPDIDGRTDTIAHLHSASA